MVDFSAVEKHKAALREAAFRARVYPNLVNRGKMTQASADRELAIMREIAADYKQQAEKERLL